ncbi:MAG: polysaccharide deacetylase family protein [Bacteroidetes bacterium]|nr:polysaccharide deacetylase family protein [Bacteroidota bacterium]
MRILKNIGSVSSILPIQRYSIVRPNLKGNANFKPVLLTFDDGPNHIDNITLDLLSVLKTHNVKAAFCLIGKNVKQHPHIVKQLFQDGHIIGNHGNTGDPFVFKRMKAIAEDIDACNNAICEAIESTAHQIEYFRPGYGAYLKKHIPFWESKNMQLLPVTDFFFDHKVKPVGMKKFIGHFTEKIKANNGGVYVLHDGRNEHPKINSKINVARSKNKPSDYDRSWVPKAVDLILSQLKEDGFTLPELNDNFPNKLNPEFRSFLFSK